MITEIKFGNDYKQFIVYLSKHIGSKLCQLPGHGLSEVHDLQRKIVERNRSVVEKGL